jgi:hypothetical protein
MKLSWINEAVQIEYRCVNNFFKQALIKKVRKNANNF